MGLSVGAVGIAGAALGAVCPLCVVVTPALLGAGLVQRMRAARMRTQAPQVPDSPETAGAGAGLPGAASPAGR